MTQTIDIEKGQEMNSDEYTPGDFGAPQSAYPHVADLLKTDLSEAVIEEWYTRDFPSGAGPGALPRRAQAVTEYRAKLAADAARYEDIRNRGAEALSRYDVEISASGDADAAVRMAMSLKFNHVMYNLRCIEVARRMAPGLLAFIESGAAVTRSETTTQTEGEQLALF
jgi:hypothetical protein